MSLPRFSPLLILVSLLVSPSLGDQAWTTFRGPDGNGIAKSTTKLPSEWSANENIVWRTELPGEGWSSPVVDKGRIYLTAAIPAESSKDHFHLSLLIVDAETGDLLDTIAVMDQTPDRKEKIHSKNSRASPTAIVSGDRVYVHFGYQGTACLSRDGKKIWENRELYFNPTHGNGGTPILVDDRLIFTCDGGDQPKIVGLDSDSGSLVWETVRPVEAAKTFAFSTPTLIQVEGRQQVIAPGADCVLALDPKTGDTIWDVRYVGYSVVPKPVYDRGLVFLSTSFDKSILIAIRPTGRGVVTDTHVAWQVDRNIPKTPSMIAKDGLVYTISDHGIAQCIDGKTGDILYKRRVGGNFSASPLMAGDLIYYTSEAGVTTVIRSGRQFEKVAENDLGERTLASAGVIDQSLLLRTKNALYRIGR